MPPAKTYKCGVCQDTIAKTQASIQCKGCKLWLHTTCADVTDKHLALFKERPNAFSFTCCVCAKNCDDDKSIREDLKSLKTSFDDFVKSSKEDFSAFKDTMAQVLSDFKKEVSSSINELKTDIVTCNKLINNIDSSTSAKFTDFELENHILHRRFNRADVVISGLPSGLNDLPSVVISLCSYYNIDISEFNLNNVCYMNQKKLILVKFGNVGLRDRLMQQYFKSRSLQVKNIIGGELVNRVYLNDHYSPCASNLNVLCRKLLHQKIILKYLIFNRDELKAKLTLNDGKEVLYDVVKCAELLSNATGAKN